MDRSDFRGIGREAQTRGLSGAPQILARRVLFLVQPDFRAKLGGIVNIESLIELFAVIRDRGELEAEFVRDRRFRLAKSKVNADYRLRRVAPLSRKIRAAWAMGCSRSSIVTAIRQEFGSLAASAGSV